MTLINTRVRSKVCYSTQDTFHAFVFFEPLGLIAATSSLTLLSIQPCGISLSWPWAQVPFPNA